MIDAEFMAAILDSLKDPLLFADTGHVTRYRNRAGAAYYEEGVSLVGRSLLDCHNQESQEMMVEILAKMHEGLDERLITDTEEHRVFMRAVRDPQGNLLGYYERFEPPAGRLAEGGTAADRRSGMAEGTATELYAMPAFPTLSTSDLEESAEFYVGGLGFQNVYSIPGPDGAPVLIHIRWTKYADVLLERESGARASPPEERGRGARLSFSLALAGRTSDDIAGRASRLGALVEGPVERPWNTRDVVVRDLDGYVLVFTEPVDVGRSMDEVLGGMASAG